MGTNLHRPGCSDQRQAREATKPFGVVSTSWQCAAPFLCFDSGRLRKRPRSLRNLDPKASILAP